VPHPFAPLVFLLLVSLALGPQAHAETPARVRVRGSARLEAHASRGAGRLVLRGILTDDSGAPLDGEMLSVSLSPASDTTRALALFTTAGIDACPRAQRRPSVVSPQQALIPTGDGGRFCAQIPMEVDRYVAHLGWGGSVLLESATLDVPVDLARRPVLLSFAPEPSVVRLDVGNASFEVVATVDDDGKTTAAPSLPITLSDERGAALGTATTNGSGHARFVVDPSKFGPPGRGELRALFDGNADTAKSVHSAPIERRTHVVLEAPDAPHGRLSPGSPDEGVTFLVTVHTPRGESVPTGSLEALLGPTLVGAAPVEAGAARMVVTFASQANPPYELRLRYAPDAPWFVPGDELALTLPERGASPWRTVGLLVAALAVIGWLVLGRRASTQFLPKAEGGGPRVSQGEARIDVVRSVRSSRAGWTGLVLDAHDGSLVAHARLSIERATFGETSVVASTLGSDHGRFELRTEDVRPGDALVVEAPLHALLRKPVPPFGELSIALVLRKRALLDRLVSWARARGRPFDQQPEPTPGHVRRAAGNDLATAQWADAVERAAFGAAEVDGTVEAAIDDLAPSQAAAKTIADPAPPAHALPEVYATAKEGPNGQKYPR
jgi:hypothetical protein